MKDCGYWQERISRLLDGDLSPEEEAALWEHIADCPDCAQAYETFALLPGAVRAQAVQPPADLSRLVMARIRGQETEPPAEEKSAPVHRLRSWRKLAAAACFVALVAAGAVTGVFGRGARLASGSAQKALYLPEAQSDTVYARVPAENGSAPQAAASGAAETADSIPVPEAVEAPEIEEAAGDVTGDAAMDTAPAEGAAAPAEDAALARSAGSGIMTIMEPAALADDGAVQVLDAAGGSAGCIEDAGALRALLTGEPWQGDAPEPVYTLTLDGEGYVFAADAEGRLLWRRDGEERFILSPASLADLQALIVSP